MTTEPLHITSPQNPQVKNLVKLRGRRARDAQELQIIEEPLVIQRAFESGCTFRTVYFCPEQLVDPHGMKLLNTLRREPPPGLEFVQLDPRVMTKVSYRARPEGLIVVAAQTRRGLPDLRLSPTPLLVVLAELEKPGNLGAILRAADGAGAEAVILSGPGIDPFNPNVLRASRGTCFTMPLATASRDEVWSFLTERGIRSVATSPAAEAAYTACDMTGAVAVVLGPEDTGLDAEWLARADQTVRIPLYGCTDSLNVAVTAALMLYEAVRQRQ